MSWCQKHPPAASHSAPQHKTVCLHPTTLIQHLMRTETKLEANKRYKLPKSTLGVKHSNWYAFTFRFNCKAGMHLKFIYERHKVLTRIVISHCIVLHNGCSKRLRWCLHERQWRLFKIIVGDMCPVLFLTPAAKAKCDNLEIPCHEQVFYLCLAFQKTDTCSLSKIRILFFASFLLPIKIQ